MSKQVRVVAVLSVLILVGSAAAQGRNKTKKHEGPATTLVTPVRIIPDPLPFFDGSNISVTVSFASRPKLILTDPSLQLWAYIADAAGKPVDSKFVATKVIPFTMPQPPGTKVSQTFESFRVPRKGTRMRPGDQLVIELVSANRSDIPVVPPGFNENTTSSTQTLPVIGAATFPFKCAASKQCKFQSDAMWIAEAKHKAQSGTSH